MKVKLIVALTGAALSAGCVLAPAPYPYAEEVAVAPGAPVEIYEPDVIIVENGIRHDRFFYQRHPEFYRRDMRRYPDRFHHHPHDFAGPGPRHGDYRFDGPRHGDPRFAGPQRGDHHNDGPRHGDPRNMGPAFQHAGPGQAPQHEDPRGKKKNKKHHDDDDRR